MNRRRGNHAWVVLGVLLALELTWCEFIGIKLWSRQDTIGLSSVDFTIAGETFGLTTGVQLFRGAPRGTDRLRFAVIEGPVRLGTESYRGGDRVVFDAYKTGRMWLPVTRTQLIDVTVTPPQFYFVQGTRVEKTPLPDGLRSKELAGFLRSPEAANGVNGFKRWAETRVR